MNDPEINKFIAQEQNQLDHITKRIYGPGVQFESLSAFGQNTIEKLARDSKLVDETDPGLREAKADLARARYENEELKQKLASVTRINEDLWEENEELKMELYDAEEDRDRWRSRSRKVSSTPSFERATEVEEPSTDRPK